MIWFTSDWHLDHEAILDLCPRPFPRLKQMEKAILKNYKEVVNKNDTVYFIGDIFFHKNKPKIESTLRNLPGKKILILGNHDKLNPFEYQELGFYQVVTWLKIKNIKQKPDVCSDSNFLDPMISVNNINEFTLIHDPAIAGCLTNKNFICGHVHKLFKKQNNVINVGVDIWDFKPVNIMQICNWLDK